MAGHVEDRWWRDKTTDTGEVVLNEKGKPVREKTDLYGKGLRYRVRYYVNRRERSKSFPDGKLGRAKAFLAKVQTDALTGTYVDPDAGKVRLRAYVADYLKGGSDDPGTQQTLQSKLERMVFDFFGDCDLVEITRDRVREWLGWMQTRGGKRLFSATYRASMFDLLSSILSAAVDDGKISENPCRAKSIKRPKPVIRKVVPWEDEKLWRIEDALPHPYKIVAHLGAGLGLRQMEAFGFSPDDIDRRKREAHIVRQVRWINGQPTFAPPKRGKTRIVPLGERLERSIDHYVDEYEPLVVTLPWVHPAGELVSARLLINKAVDGIRRRILQNPHSARLWQAQTFHSDIWVPAFTAAGLTYVKHQDGTHALRHYYASTLLEQGVSIKALSEYLGHSNPAFTLKVYTHLMPSSHESARRASDKIFKPRVIPGAA
ncbi:tyrosine-type recombinase/integrase [Actinophytocola sp.]|uniref:tyrosine-type recombinase/integrase n=1 Tax=Actinophytocola sp. TaxID=1872138 RepID=UPI003D6BC8D2